MGILVSTLLGIATAFMARTFFSVFRRYHILLFIVIGLVTGIAGSVAMKVWGFAEVTELNIFSLAISFGLAVLTLVIISVYNWFRQPRVPQLDEHELQLTGG